MSEDCERKSLVTANLFPLLLIDVALPPKSLRNRQSLQTTLSEGRGGEAFLGFSCYFNAGTKTNKRAKCLCLR